MAWYARRAIYGLRSAIGGCERVVCTARWVVHETLFALACGAWRGKGRCGVRSEYSMVELWHGGAYCAVMWCGFFVSDGPGNGPSAPKKVCAKERRGSR
jgi:hypothetical protein